LSKSNRSYNRPQKPVNTPIAYPVKTDSIAVTPTTHTTPVDQSIGCFRRWWSTFTNDFGMFCLTLLTLTALIVYTYYTRALVKDTEASYTDVQRAFVSPEQPIKVEATGSGNDKAWTFTSTMRNDGATPTKNLKFYQSTPCVPKNGALFVTATSGPLFQCNFDTKSGQVLPPEPFEPEEVFKHPERFHFQTYSLAPHGSATIDKVTISEADLNKMVSDGHPWFIQGIAHYNDIFSTSVLHRTEYCVKVVIWDNFPLFIPCPKWNCTDDDCN
jgi:hypothetical protein